MGNIPCSGDFMSVYGEIGGIASLVRPDDGYLMEDGDYYLAEDGTFLLQE